ncbi:MAG: hypothetical protein HY308_17250 [Gammaproteobacteria bacterium]|nr:hypothetical protein [Gammaproteobacteria bacterium]
MSEVRELTASEVTAIRAAIEYRLASIREELDEHERGICILDDDRVTDLDEQVYWYDSQLLYRFEKAEKEAFGLRDATNPTAEPYPDTAADKLVLLEFKDISYIRAALDVKIGSIEMDLKRDHLDEAKRQNLQVELGFYQKLFSTFETAETMAPKLREIPQIAYRRRWK